MTKDEHRAEHKKLHNYLDVLMADFILHTKGLPSRTSLLKFLNWSFTQTINPTDVREEAGDE